MAGVEQGGVNPVEVDEFWAPIDPGALEAEGIAEAYKALDEEAGVASSTIGDPSVPFGRGVIHELGSRRERIRDSIPGRAAREQERADEIAEAIALGQKDRLRELLEGPVPDDDEKFIAKPTGKYIGKCALRPGEAERILAEEHGIHGAPEKDMDLAELYARFGFEEGAEAAA